MSVLSEFISAHYLRAWCPLRPEMGITSFELELEWLVSLHMGAGNGSRSL